MTNSSIPYGIREIARNCPVGAHAKYNTILMDQYPMTLADRSRVFHIFTNCFLMMKN